MPSKELNEVVETVQVVRLEETPESLISSINQVQFTDDLMVFPHGRNRDVMVFNNTGGFIHKWNHYGQGPEEYSNIQDIWLESDTVVIYERGKAILRYSIEGDFISSDAMKYQADHVKPYADGYFLDTNFNTIKDSLNYKAVVLDSDLSITDMLLPVESFSKVAFYSNISGISRFQNDILYLAMLSDTVYQYSRGELTPRFHFNFGDDWFWEGNERDTEDFYNKISKNPKVYATSAVIGDQYLYLFASLGFNDFRKYLIDYQNGKVLMLKRFSQDKLKYGVNLLSWNQQDLIGIIASSEVREWLDAVGESRYEFLADSDMELLESSENPVLLKIKLKDSSEW